MNFLAHAYLSFQHPDILTGNLITDFMRGHKKEEYPFGIQVGIALHHEIDTFTDQHPATCEAKEYLRPASGRYCSVFMDVVYDHFLATDTSIFTKAQLADFSQHTYHTLEENRTYLPERFKKIFVYMKKEDWLFHYRTKRGIRNSFGGIYRRAKYIERSSATFEAFLTHYEKFQQTYSLFMPEMIAYAKAFLLEMGFYRSDGSKLSDP